ncbi:MAG: N-acetyltransferase family protein [Hyphomonadaceae bacterium]
MIRRLTASHLTAYRALRQHGLRESPEAFVETAEEEAKRSDDEYTAMLARGDAWGAFVDEKLVASMVIDAIPGAALAHTRWIHAMYAHPDGRGGGVARRLVETALADAEAQGVTHFLLWVSSENPRARRFYESLGFRETGRIAGGLRYGGRPADDVLMCLRRDA